ncbi:hypothetical protein JCM10908_002528 [Rhodotorula pacifica]|uniref:uncharacterized protein n=1 Tax=Rhodotorula pacifica TaxID=1495444 RepID=UPI00316EC208
MISSRKHSLPEETLHGAKSRNKRAKEVVRAGEEQDKPPLDPLLVSRFAGATHEREDVEAVLRRFPVLCQRNFFVVQNHHATSKHFDLRLQVDNKLLSWAIPRQFHGLDKEGNYEIDGPHQLAIETPPHYFSEAINEGRVLHKQISALWDVGYYEVGSVALLTAGLLSADLNCPRKIDTYHSDGDLDAADTLPESYAETWPAEDLSQEDKFRQAFHFCRWLDVPPSPTSAGVPERGPTGGQRKFSVILHGERFKDLRLTFFRDMLDSYHSVSKDPRVPNYKTRWRLYVPKARDKEEKAARNATTSILSGMTMEQIKESDRQQYAHIFEDYKKRTQRQYIDVKVPLMSRAADQSECEEALAAFKAAGEF